MVPVGPLGPIKKKATFVARWGAGFPAGRVMPESPLADFGRVRGEAGFVVSPRSRRRKGHGDAPCAPARQGWAGAAAASVKVMEMQVGRRPVYGGAPRHPLKIAANATTRGVQGSCGPLVGGRRIETAGPLVLSVMKEQR